MQRISGVFTAVATPFDEKFKVDLKAFGKLVKWQLENEVNGLLIAGSTGEGSVLNDEEFSKLIQTAVKLSKGKIPVFAGAGFNCTASTIERIKVAEASGADGVMLITPYYNKPNQEGLYQHFSATAKSTKLPIMLYNNPARSIINLEIETLERLLIYKNIIAIKDSPNNVLKFGELSALNSDLAIFTGDDANILVAHALGAHGVTSTTANIVPDLIVNLQNLCQEKNFDEALKLHNSLYNLINLMFIDANPIPVKYALSCLGLCKNVLRLPLTPLDKDKSKKIFNELKKFYEL